jgi:hypothetical protein
VPTHRLAGTVRYYLGAQPVPSAVVEVQSGGSPLATTSTGSAGDYALGNVPEASARVVPRKTGGAGAAIGALDAAYVLQAIAGKRSLQPLQVLAADVTGDGRLDSADVTRILQRTVGLLPQFPAALLCGSDWLFVPAPAPAPGQSALQPVLGSGTCTPGAIAFAPLTGDAAGQDFQGVLIGDVTGNWLSGP